MVRGCDVTFLGQATQVAFVTVAEGFSPAGKFRGQATQVAFVTVAEGFSPAGPPIVRTNTSHPMVRSREAIYDYS
jgi:hypothetical protein